MEGSHPSPGKNNIKKLLAGFNVACLLTGLLLSGGGCSPSNEDEKETVNSVPQEKQGQDIQTRKYQPGQETGPASGKKIRGKSG